MTTTGRSVQGNYTYKWPRPAVTVDSILVSKELPSKVLLIQRKQDPFAGSSALPGKDLSISKQCPRYFGINAALLIRNLHELQVLNLSPFIDL